MCWRGRVGSTHPRGIMAPMRVSVGTAHMFVEVFGQNEAGDRSADPLRPPTLIGLHGGPGIDGATLRHWLKPLAEAAQVVVPDLRGHGRSDRGSPEDWNLTTWAADIRRLCTALDIERPVLLGLSFGGFVAQQYAAAYPSDLAGLILVSTAPRYPTAEDVLNRARDIGGEETSAALCRLMEHPEMEPTAEDRQRVESLYQRRPDTGAQIARHTTIHSPDVAQAWAQHAPEALDLRPALASVRCPTLVMAGELDPFNPPSLAAEIVEAIPDQLARMVVVPDAAHRVFADNPDFVYDMIRPGLLH